MKNFIKKNKGVLFGVATIIVVLFIGLIALEVYAQRQITANIEKEKLQILANEKAAQVNLFLESQKEKLLTIASMNVFKEALMYPNDATKIEVAKNRINELKSIIPGISLLNSEGIVYIGDIDLPGTDYSQHPYFLAKRQDIMFARYYDPLRKGDYYVIVGPIYANADKSKPIGRIAFDIRLDKISALMNESLDGKNDEVYLIDETGLLLSDSEYIGVDNEKGVLIQEVKSEGAKECLEDLNKYGREGFVERHEEEIPLYLNYMGNEVFGAHAYVTSIMGCVIAEKSADEITKFSLTGDIINIFKKEVEDEI